MNKLFDHIANTLDIDELKPEEKKTIIKPDDPNKTLAEQDFNVSRKTMLKALDTAHKHLEDVIDTASSYQKPSGWEAAAVFMKAMSEIAKDLKELHDEPKSTGQKILAPGMTVNKTVFVGTTTQLLEELKKQKEIVIDVEPN